VNNITRRLAADALREYLQLREELGGLEARESECTSDLNEFHRCDLCTETRDKAHRLRGLLDLWGEQWAVLLDRSRKMLGELREWLDDIGDGAPDSSPTQKRALNEATQIGALLECQ
jgi:hypothetical protein